MKKHEMECRRRRPHWTRTWRDAARRLCSVLFLLFRGSLPLTFDADFGAGGGGTQVYLRPESKTYLPSQLPSQSPSSASSLLSRVTVLPPIPSHDICTQFDTTWREFLLASSAEGLGQRYVPHVVSSITHRLERSAILLALHHFFLRCL